MASVHNSVQNSQTRTVRHNHTLYSESAQRILQQGVPPPTSSATYSPPACSNLQQLLNELSGTRTTSLREMTPLSLYENIEQAIQPLVPSQVDREIKIQTSNKYSVNKVLLQQILETVGQITTLKKKKRSNYFGYFK